MDTPDTASIAELYAYWLGGCGSAAVQAAAQQIEQATPAVPESARQNRAFLTESVRRIARAGITRFLDIGSGLPVSPNVHEIAQGIAPESRVVYADYDPDVVAQAEASLSGVPLVRAIQGDARTPDVILADERVRELLDGPVCLILVAVLPWLDDEEAAHTMRVLRDAVSPGSWLVWTHGTVDAVDGDTDSVQRRYAGASTPVRPRTREQCERLLDGWELEAPGLVRGPVWGGDGVDASSCLWYSAVGCKR